MQKHDGFSSKLGFILAAAGSAVGLGNIWRFPYLTAKYGGAMFLVVYLILVLTFGYALLLSENAIGKMTQKGPVGSFRDICASKPGLLTRLIRPGGWLNAIVPLIIIPYYCVIGGWVVKYTVALCINPISAFDKDATVMVNGIVQSASAHYFKSFISSTWEPIIFFMLFMAVMLIVVAFGVEKGVERFNKILMPLLAVLIVGICVYCSFLPNAEAGFRYYLMPDPGRFSLIMLVEAVGQLFFSLSIAMGIMITYGSYMRKEDDLVSSVNHVQIFDTAIAFLAGMMIIPAVVAFGGEEAAANAGPGLVFVTMPQVFASFPGGQFIGILFFVLVLFAAATSAISILETNIQTTCQELHLSRKKAIILNSVEVIGIGLITVLGYSVLSHVKPLSFISMCQNMDILDSLDFISNRVLMPIGAIFVTMLVLFGIGLKKMAFEIRGGKPWGRKIVYNFCMAVIVIPCLILILLNSFGIIQ